jgi:pimeloyl-ACP methyl ester carboxylesterase
MALTSAFLVEFLSEGRYPLLSSLTDRPTRRRLTVRGVEVVALTARRARAPLVLVHGLAPRGNRDRRVLAAAALLARAGFAVVVPTIPGLTRGRLRLDDVEPVLTALTLYPGPETLVAVSLGAGPALLAAADPSARDRVETVVVLGGYASARELARYFLTGEYAYGGRGGHTAHDPALVRGFIAANADLLDSPTRRALEDGDAGAVDAALHALAPLLDALSPERVASRIPGRVILIHGRGDRAVPYTETLRMAAARPRDTAVVVVGVIGHMTGEGRGPALTAAREILALWGAAYSMIGRR